MKYLVIFLFVVTILLALPRQSLAIIDPLKLPNNKFGIHILFDSELGEAAKLVNSNGGDWGYVTIPIQSGDKDLEKWQHFMDECKRLHIIPLIRLATAGDYFNRASWRKPSDDDIIDFANFLNSLDWPTKNRYIIVYNEVNRGDEWGGDPNPSEYAELLSFAVSTFKNVNSDFFIISSGMDNASANANNAMNEYSYFRQMDMAVPGVFSQIDGIASHSYPNPAFIQPPTSRGQMSIASFKYEKSLIDSLAGKNLPVFITETGWDNTKIPQDKLGEYFKEAYTDVWNDDSVVAVTPFLLRAGGDAFKQFSFFLDDGKESEQYKAVSALPKVKGQPPIDIPDHQAVFQAAPTDYPTINFGKGQIAASRYHLSETLTTAFHWIFKL